MAGYPLAGDITLRANQVIKRVQKFSFYPTEELFHQRFSGDEDLPPMDQMYGAVFFDGERIASRNPQRDPHSNLQEMESNYIITLFARRTANRYGQAQLTLLQSAIPQIYSAFSGWAPKVRSGANSSFCPGLVKEISRPSADTKLIYITAAVAWPYVTSVAAEDYDCVFDDEKVSPWYIDSTTGDVVFTTGPNEEPA